MAANTSQIFPIAGDIQGVDAVLLGNTTRDGTSGTIYTVFTADATNGGRLEKLRFTAKGTNVQTVARVFVNNGSATTVAANNHLVNEVSLAPSTVSETGSLPGVEWACAMMLPPGYKVFVTLGTQVAAGFSVVGYGSKY